MSDFEYKVIVGMEIHVHLHTNTKMFCSCALEFAAKPNSRVCQVCLGLPGVLPVMNKKAFEFAVLVGMALNCSISKFTKWDRKHYYYPDLPKNYQISQYDLPLSENGFIEIPLESGRTKKIRITRTHLEEDAGKNIHSAENFSQVDLNRTGTPLLEIVTEPDLNTPAEVKKLATELQRIVRYLGVSQADMQKGHMRFEPNINLIITKDGKEYKTPIVEIKNLNSFRVLEKSVEYEIQRQLDDFLETGKVMQMGNKSTRGWDDVNQVTVLQREKEEANDYRYFPEPDLLPVELSDDWLDEIRSNLCELPVKKQLRYVTEYNLSDYDASVLTADRSTAEFFEQAVAAGGDTKRLCNLITQTGLKLAHEADKNINEIGLKPDNIAQLAKMIDSGDVNTSAANTIMEHMIKSDKDPRSIAHDLNLIQKSDAAELETIVDHVIADNPNAVEDVKAGGKKSKKAQGFLLGQVMQKTKGQANPKIVSKILNKKLS